MKFTTRVLLVNALSLVPAASAATTTAERAIQEEFERARDEHAIDFEQDQARLVQENVDLAQESVDQLQTNQAVCATNGPYGGVSQTLPASVPVGGSYLCGDGTIFVSAFWSSDSEAVVFSQPVDPTAASITAFGSYEACMNVLCYNPTSGVSDTTECCTTIEMVPAPGALPIAAYPGKPTPFYPTMPPRKPSPSPTMAPRKPSPSPTITPRPPTEIPSASPVKSPTKAPVTAKPTYEPTPRPTFPPPSK
jgi:hypothetical protein